MDWERCISIASDSLPHRPQSLRDNNEKNESQKAVLHALHPQIHLHRAWVNSLLRQGLREQGKQAGSQCWPGKHGTVLCSMLAAAENTHGPKQMAAEEGDRLTDENCRGYPTWEFSQAEKEREKLTVFSIRLQRGFRRNLLYFFFFFFSNIHQRTQLKSMWRCERCDSMSSSILSSSARQFRLL